MTSLTKISTIEAEITSDGQLVVSTQLVKELFLKGYKKVKIEIFSKNTGSELSDNNTNLAEKIKNIQGIPLHIALDFMKSKGTLKNFSIIFFGQRLGSCRGFGDKAGNGSRRFRPPFGVGASHKACAKYSYSQGVLL